MTSGNSPWSSRQVHGDGRGGAAGRLRARLPGERELERLSQCRDKFGSPHIEHDPMIELNDRGVTVVTILRTSRRTL
jgi:hypothetical protein